MNPSDKAPRVTSGPGSVSWAGAVLFLSLLMVQMAGADPLPAEQGRVPRQETHRRVPLLNSLEIRGPLGVLTQWKRILRDARSQMEKLKNCIPGSDPCPPGAASWKEFLSRARGMTGFDQLKFVNRFFNRWPYRLDKDIYGVSDYWATPQEFLRFSGDCEDYCITKYFALRELGYYPEQLRIVVLRDAIRNITHATLAVYLDNHVYILDNLSDGVFDQGRYSHYFPQYSFNEQNRWAHIPLKAFTPKKLSEEKR
ncbi:MAG: transglutaminase-like cysteine peptidase [Deltaproteobacteria bacterium]|nr:transglutaminase-like cysteine peptidase [Deltaproteobacteria bacterium]MBW2129905.1 transglutaminase-like cysteine peptidase [Deltaproteobacteria bacterium]